MKKKLLVYCNLLIIIKSITYTFTVTFKKFNMKKFALLTLISVVMLIAMGNKRGRAKESGEGNTGAPGDKSYYCSNCHSNGSYNLSANINVKDNSGATVTEYIPGTAYNISVVINTVSGSTPAVYGFQMVGLYNSTNTDLNGFSNPGTNTQVTLKNNRHYLEHSNPYTNNTFTGTWTAPATGSGPITFYAAVVGGNNNNDDSGDKSYKLSLSLSEKTASNRHTMALPALAIYPNPARETVNILPTGNGIPASIQLTDINGNTQLFSYNPLLNLDNLAPGFYQICVMDKSGNLIGTGKFIRQ